MINKTTTIKITLVALLLAMTFVPAVAQDYDEIELTPQLQTALETYDEAQYFSEGMARVKKDGKYGFVNAQGKEIVTCKYDYAYPFSNGLAKVCVGEEDNEKWGYVNSGGIEIVPCKYDYIDYFSDGLAKVGIGEEYNEKYGYVNTSGIEVVPCIYDMAGVFHEGMACVRVNGKYGYVNSSGEEVIPCIYDETHIFSDGLLMVIRDYKYGFVNARGEEIVPCKYDYADFFVDGLALVQTGEWASAKYGFVNTFGEEIVPCKYDYAESFVGGMALVKSNGKYGFINVDGKEVVSCIYDAARSFHEGMALVISNGKCGFINTDGEEVVPCKYDEANSFKDGMALVKSNGKYGFINADGKEVVSCKYDQVSWINDNVSLVKLNGKYGLIDDRGQEIASCIYDMVQTDYSNYCFVLIAISQGKYGILDTDGNFTYSRNVNVDDIFWIPGDWAKKGDYYSTPELTISRNGEVSFVDENFFTISKKVIVSYDNATDKYFVVCPGTDKDSKYQIDFDEWELITMDGTRLTKRESVEVPLPPSPMEYMEERELIPEPKATSDEVFHSAATLPEYPGGYSALMSFLSAHVRYPQEAQKNKAQGKVVVQFVVEKDGTVGEVEVARSVDKYLDQEAVRVCKALPRFTPGKNANGDPVRVWFTVPVNFKLQSTAEEDEGESNQ